MARFASICSEWRRWLDRLSPVARLALLPVLVVVINRIDATDDPESLMITADLARSQVSPERQVRFSLPLFCWLGAGLRPLVGPTGERPWPESGSHWLSVIRLQLVKSTRITAQTCSAGTT